MTFIRCSMIAIVALASTSITIYNYHFFLFLKGFIYLSLERGRQGEREGEKHQCVVASRTSTTADLACNPGMCPDWESNLRPLGSQAGTQSTEPHQPGIITIPLVKWEWLRSKLVCNQLNVYNTLWLSIVTMRSIRSPGLPCLPVAGPHPWTTPPRLPHSPPATGNHQFALCLCEFGVLKIPHISDTI